MTRGLPLPLRLRPAASGFRLAALAVAALLTGCTAPVAGNLTEEEANRVIVALERAGVDTTKEVDPGSEGRYRVVVPREDASRAVLAMREEELPPRAAPGVLEAMGKSSIVPSSAVEHAQFLAGLSGELERTLTSIDGVVAARVHVSVPPPDPLGDTKQTRGTASVLLKHRGATPPIDSLAVQRLVAGAVAGMKPDEVAVVLISRPSVPLPPDRQLARVGPILVTKSSVTALRAILAGAVLLTLVLTTALVLVWARGRRNEPEEKP